jgi:hypothetical protein
MYLSRTLRHRLALLLNCLILFALATKAQNPKSSLDITLRCSSPVVKSGQAVLVYAAITNESNEHLLLRDPRLGPKEAGVTVSDSNGKKLRPIRGLEPDRTVGPSGLGLAPNKSALVVLPVGQWFDLTKPGTYYVQISKRQPKSDITIESNKLAISIVP